MYTQQKTHHGHYLIYVQLALLIALLAIGAGKPGLMVVIRFMPLAVTLVLTVCCARMTIKIIEIVEPSVRRGRVDFMHGSTIPPQIYYPEFA